MCFAFLSVSKFIKTGVGDKNEYPLYFEKVIYEVDIDENVEINHNFLNVSAKTHGEGKYYDTTYWTDKKMSL